MYINFIPTLNFIKNYASLFDFLYKKIISIIIKTVINIDLK
jgi:hypothetical protein